ncbi:MAG: RluA family pseudouridine synthase [Lachnospiraceae bacterium]|nr:RluA family pseudouridine synthase [Lachnospiraceae bacterium]
MEVIYEDDDILVIDKPAGQATQSSRIGEKDLESECRKYRKQKGESPEIYVVHRLDQPVSGLLLFAKNKNAAAVLSKDMQQFGFIKEYKARVLKPEQGFVSINHLEDYLIKDSKSNTSRVAKSSTDPGAKRAALSYVTTGEDEETAEVLIKLDTGRHHQIRVQFANAGMPLLGDLKYGSEKSKMLSGVLGINSVCLRAYRLTFRHPTSHKEMEFVLNR